MIYNNYVGWLILYKMEQGMFASGHKKRSNPLPD